MSNLEDQILNSSVFPREYIWSFEKSALLSMSGGRSNVHLDLVDPSANLIIEIMALLSTFFNLIFSTVQQGEKTNSIKH